jgi:uncharacterized protein YaiI (UPF0178 family)
VYRVASRLALAVFVVANGSRPLRPPGLPTVRMVFVGQEADAADDWIAAHIGRGDVCVTSDIPLAARCLRNGARVLAPNGRVWCATNIGEALVGREISRHLRELGARTSGPTPLTKHDRGRFLSALDTEIRRAWHDRGADPPRPEIESGSAIE